jgi:membrane protein YdbS with pleckstrin-like domain
MFERTRRLALRWLRVPPEPQPPLGAPGSVRTFRAGRNLYKLRLAAWGFGQIGGIIGICFSLWFLSQFEAGANAALDRRAKQVVQKQAAEKAAKEKAAAEARATPPTESAVAPAPPAKPAEKPAKPKRSKLTRAEKFAMFKNGVGDYLSRQPTWVFPLLRILELVAILGFLAQLPFTYSLVRLEFEQHWYVVTDRSLRIRTGLWTLQESTMSFANLQQVEMHQGPLQRLLGLADLRVQSAGGGGDYDPHHGGDSLHRGVFHSVENATEVRDLILERLRLFRAAGLGDPDEPMHAAAAGDPSPGDNAAASVDTFAAAQELLAEARALRVALS